MRSSSSVSVGISPSTIIYWSNMEESKTDLWTVTSSIIDRSNRRVVPTSPSTSLSRPCAFLRNQSTYYYVALYYVKIIIGYNTKKNLVHTSIFVCFAVCRTMIDFILLCFQVIDLDYEYWEYWSVLGINTSYYYSFITTSRYYLNVLKPSDIYWICHPNRLQFHIDVTTKLKKRLQFNRTVMLSFEFE